MQERQELLDHQALFSDRPWREIPFERTRGLLGNIRATEKALVAEREREEALLPPPVKTHAGSEPLELPPTAPAVTTPPAAPAEAKPAVRVER
jgi:hypothetical protein